MMEKIDVNGESQHPIYAELDQVADAEGHSGDIRWNFEKFLIAPDGSITRFSPMVTPDDPTLVSAIEASLAQLTRAIDTFAGPIRELVAPERSLGHPAAGIRTGSDPEFARMRQCSDESTRGSVRKRRATRRRSADLDLPRRDSP